MSASRSPGIKLIITYKWVKAALMVTLALWLTLAPQSAYHVIARVIHEFAEWGKTWTRISAWLDLHINERVVLDTKALAWIDASTSTLEGFLLFTDRAWGNWIVVAGTALLIPFECWSLWHRPRIAKAVLVALNIAVVFYLIRMQIRKRSSRAE